MCPRLCALSVNQHCSICGGFAPGKIERDTVTSEVFQTCDCGVAKHFAGDLCEMNKFDEMMKLLCVVKPEFGQVVAVDARFEIFSRAWCVAELVKAHYEQMPQALKIHSKKALKKYRRHLEALDMRECDASRPEDKAEILSKIPDVDEFNDHLRRLLLDANGGLIAQWEKEVTESGYFQASANCLELY